MSPAGVGARQISLAAAVVTLISSLIWTLNRIAGGLVPEVSPVAVGLLLVMAGLVLVAAWPVRTHLAGKATKPLDALRAARAGVLAQAATLVGAGIFGWYLGQILVSLADVDLMVVRASLLGLGLALAASIVLTVAGLVAQRWCRHDPPRDDAAAAT